MSYGSPSVFESYNAKNLKPRQVAETFVPSDNFKQLTQRRNSLIIGPRGSGKTTLLKMLQNEALDSWKHKDAESYVSKIDFNGVFIPTDRVWKEQVDSLTKNIQQGETIATAIFTTHILYRLSTSFKYISSKLDKANTEHDFIKQLAEVWHLKIESFSYLSLLSALSIRKSEIPRLANELSSSSDSSSIYLDEYKYLFLDFIQSISSSVELFNSFYNTAENNWALLFDELELAPNCVVQKLIDSLRGSNDNLIFKLSMSPFSPDITIVKDMFSAMAGNDHDFIRLWSAKKVGSNKLFSNQLLKSMLKERGLEDVDPDTIFGKPRLILHSTLINNAWENDPTFKQYLADKGFDNKSIEKADPNIKDSIVRKVIPLLKIRNVARNPYREGQPAKYRSLKSLPNYYSGSEKIFEILEDNPRWLIGVLSPLLDEYQNTQKKIKPDRQLKEINSAMQNFFYLLKTIPSPIQRSKRSSAGIEFTIDLIGEYFKKEVILQDFKDQPHGSFYVDRNVDVELRNSLGAALNAGALVEVGGHENGVFLSDLIDRRFRLSYLLAPKYRQPILLMTGVSLSSILKDKEDKFSYAIPLFE